MVRDMGRIILLKSNATLQHSLFCFKHVKIFSSIDITLYFIQVHKTNTITATVFIKL